MGFFGESNSGSTGGGGGGNENVGPAGAKYVGGKKNYWTVKDAKDASKRHEFRQAGAKRIDKLKIPSIWGTALKPLFKAGSRITRDYFTDKVLTSKRGRKNFGMNKAKFESLSIAKQNEIYKGYMEDRMSDRTDAYGNVFQRGEGIKTSTTNNNKSQGIELAKESTTSATILGPAEIQKQAANTIKGPTTVEMTANEIALANKRKGRKVTQVTGATGLAKDYTLSKKSILG